MIPELITGGPDGRAGRRARVLLVDDEPLMRLSMVDALEAIGHDVETAASGTEGIEAIRQRPFDLVITDLRLPGADGLMVLTAAKEQSPHTEVVVITLEDLSR